MGRGGAAVFNFVYNFTIPRPRANADFDTTNYCRWFVHGEGLASYIVKQTRFSVLLSSFFFASGCHSSLSHTQHAFTLIHSSINSQPSTFLWKKGNGLAERVFGRRAARVARWVTTNRCLLMW